MKPITLITGGAGFIGPHLCEWLVAAGEEILWLDNFYTGNKDNIRMRIPLETAGRIATDARQRRTARVSKDCGAATRRCRSVLQPRRLLKSSMRSKFRAVINTGR